MKRALDGYLRNAIPLYQAMGASVVTAGDDEVVIAASLAPNTNHQGTAFGGSIASLATLACWGWLWTVLQPRHAGAALVVARAEIDYLEPVTGDFIARCVAPPADAVEELLARLVRKGRARIELAATVEDGAGAVCARFAGRFAATAPR